ncbi:MAG TPA: fibronectin type III domain-containing protein, partial [Kofleriaceae bacterium]|nr:fibronectin type III domain-containing protein [Kofleriaceae bacterium]
NEASAATAIAGAGGTAQVAVTLGQGAQAIRATCLATSGSAAGASAVTTVQVDTEAPVCTLINPGETQAVIPAMDEDGATDGTQITLRGQATGGDVTGEAATFTVGALEVDATAMASDGTSTATGSFTSPGTTDIAFSTQDHAGNACASEARAVSYVTEGCAITHVAPVDVITADGDPDTAGLQTDLVVNVDEACAGQTVTTTCDIGGETTAVVAAGGGDTTVGITVCEDDHCEVAYDCATSVTDENGIVTSAPATLHADTLAPPVTLRLIDPSNLDCGDFITSGVDVQPSVPGVQIKVRDLSPLAVDRHVTVTNSAGSVDVPAGPGGDARVTLAEGPNSLAAVAADQYGNTATTATCTLTLVDILVAFSPPVDDGRVSASEGSVSGAGITFDLKGTVSITGATVNVAIDGGPDQAATVSGTTWTLPGVTLSEGPHTLVASAKSGADTGSRSQKVTVDLGAPDTIADLAAFATTRQSAELSWTAPADNGAAVAGYVVKVATSPITEANFETTGSTVTPPVPAAPGSAQAVVVEKLRAGTAYHFAVAAFDSAGNRSPIAAEGPVIPAFDESGAIAPPGAGDGDDKAAGIAMTGGDFNGDGFADLAVGAPFADLAAGAGAGEVHVYLGGPSGLAATPAVTIESDEASAQLGNAVTTVRWNDDDTDDLAIGAPFADSVNGHVYILLGGSQLDDGAPSPIIAATAASTTIGAHAVIPGGFSGSGLGFSLATARFDDDARDDLIVGAPLVNGVGGAVVVFGGQPGASIELSTVQDTGARAALLPNPISDNNNGLLGSRVFNLGRTGAADRTDDVALVYDNDLITADAVLVWRGRDAEPAPGVDPLAWDASVDLRIDADANSSKSFAEQVAAVGDVDDDGRRDLAIAEFRAGGGRVFIVDGGAVGAHHVADLGITTITAETGITQLGEAVLNNADGDTADIDGDGQKDLVIAGGKDSGNVFLFVWFGGDIPTGAVTTASAAHRIEAPPEFAAAHVNDGQPAPITARWVGDVTGLGLDDIVWADWRAGSEDGAFELLSDDGQ